LERFCLSQWFFDKTKKTLDRETGKKAIKLTSNRGSLMRNIGTRSFPSNFTAGVEARRQPKIASSFRLQKKRKASPNLEKRIDDLQG